VSATTTSSTILASVIVPGLQPFELTRRCVTALARYTRAPWELVAVDDGSTDGTADYLAGVADAASFGVRVVTNAQSCGFAAACNQGLAAARGDYLVLRARKLSSPTPGSPSSSRWLTPIPRSA
jgi:GT2 family glycosyltransferase